MPKKTSRPVQGSKYSSKSAEYENPIASRDSLLELIQGEQVPVSQEHIARALGYTDEASLEALRRRLKAMVRDGQLLRNRRGGYLGFDHEDLVKGVVQSHPDGWCRSQIQRVVRKLDNSAGKGVRQCDY